MTLKRTISAALLTALTMGAAAQSLNTAYFTKDYLYRHTMNPATGNDSTTYIAVPALGNVNVSMHGNYGYGDVVMHNPLFPSQSDKRMTTFMNPYISVEDALSGFNKGTNRMAANVDLTLLSAGFRAWGGYNTVSIAAKAQADINLPYELFEFAKNTGNRRYDIGDIDARVMSYAELALGHSRQINQRLRLGAKLKVLLGIARGDVKMRNMAADLTAPEQWTITGEATANVSMKGFTYIEDTKEYNRPEAGTYQCVDDVDIDGAGLGGFGMAVDLGGEYRIDDAWTVSAAVTDLGFISWSNNMQARNMSQEFVFNGFHDTSVTSDHGETIDDKADKYGDQLTQFANLTSQGDQGSRTTALAATVNAGCLFTLPAYKALSFGLLSTTRINGAYTWTEGRLSANWAPLSWLDGGVSLAVNTFATDMGWVINIHPKGFNLFIGMDHTLGKQSKEGIPLSSNASLNLGMNITI